MSYYQQGYPGGQYGAPPPGQYPPPGGYQQPAYGAHQHYAPPPGPPHSQYPPQGGYQQPGAYGAHSQQQYAPPPGQYGQQQQYAPPPGPPGHYGQQQYAPPTDPPPGQYGHQQYAPPPGPPPNQYVPPVGPLPGQYQQPGYGVPPTHGASYGAPTPASLGYGPPQHINWDARPDAEMCRKAMKGFGTNENMLINAVASKDPLQIDAIKAAFRDLFSRDLMKDVKSETSGDLEFGLLAVIRGPCLNDAYEIHRAVEGPGTNERALNDILLSRSNADILAIKNMYRQAFRRDLDRDVIGDLSMKTARMFEIILSAKRAEDSVQPTQHQVETDVRELYNATEGRMGTDEIKVCSIMALRNDAQIRAIAEAYKHNYSRNLEEVLKKEFSGHMEDALVYQLRHAIDPADNAAQELERAMRGMGTDEKALARRLIKIHWNRNFMETVKNRYHQRYRTDLTNRIRSELSGDFERLMLACLGYPC